MKEHSVERQHNGHERFVELFLPIQRSLYHYARSLCSSHEDAADLFGETVLAGLQSYDPEHPTGTFRSFLFTIATRIHRRRRYRGRHFAPGTGEFFDSLPGSITEPDVPVDVQILYRALAELQPKQREAVALFELSGLSLKEIQEIQGGTLSGVKSRIARGRQELARRLGVRASSGDGGMRNQQEGKNQTQTGNPFMKATKIEECSGEFHFRTITKN